MEELLKQILGEIKTINTRLDNMDSRLDNMDSRLDSMDSRLDSMDSRLSTLESKVDENTKSINHLNENMEVQFKITNGLINGATNKIDDLKSHTDTIEASNASRHTEISVKLQEINDSIEFLEHKGSKTEKDVFTIKKKLQIAP